MFLKIVKSPEDPGIFLNMLGKVTKHLKGNSALLSY